MVLFSTGCPKCKVLETKLTAAGIPFTISDDADLMRELGFYEAPILEKEGEYLTFSQAIKWLNASAATSSDCASCKL